MLCISNLANFHWVKQDDRRWRCRRRRWLLLLPLLVSTFRMRVYFVYDLHVPFCEPVRRLRCLHVCCSGPGKRRVCARRAYDRITDSEKVKRRRKPFTIIIIHRMNVITALCGSYIWTALQYGRIKKRASTTAFLFWIQISYFIFSRYILFAFIRRRRSTYRKSKTQNSHHHIISSLVALFKYAISAYIHSLSVITLANSNCESKSKERTKEREVRR